MKQTLLSFAAAAAATVMMTMCCPKIELCETDSITLSEWSFSRDSASWEEVTIPHSTNAIDGHSESYYRGKTYYRRDIEVCDVAKPAYILFEGAAQKSIVYLNGEEINVHGGGYTAFTVDVTGMAHEGKNDLLVICDNTEDIELIPVSSDFNKNNGLHNEVHLMQKEMVHIDPVKYGPKRINAYSEAIEGGARDVKVIDNRTSVWSDELLHVVTAVKSVAQEVSATVVCRVLDINGGVAAEAEKKVSVAPGAAVDVDMDIEVKNAHMWHGKHDPYLYTIEIAVFTDAVLTDIATTKYGFRHITLDGERGFMLNDLLYPLRGVSVHQDKEGMASAMKKSDYDQDYAMISEIGATMVRLAHYPHNDYVFSLCDSLGLVVQTEIPWVNVCGERATQRYFDNIHSQATEMTRNLMNHPCICFWGLWNELDTWGNNDHFQGALDCDAVVRETAAAYDVVREIDPSRPIGITDCSTLRNSGYTHLKADFISENRYNGWYYTPNQFEYFTSDMVDIRAKSDCKVINVSEYGVGINPYCHTWDMTIFKGDPDKTHHYEEYGNLSHESHWQQICAMPWLNFTTLWVMYDFAVASREEGYLDSDDGVNFVEAEQRKYTNDKGLVTRDRKLKKDAFYLYKAAWNNDVTTVYIANKRLAKMPADREAKVKVYSNAKSLSLYHNGKLKQTLGASGEISGVIWQFSPVSLEQGKNIFRVESDGGIEDEWSVESF